MELGSISIFSGATRGRVNGGTECSQLRKTKDGLGWEAAGAIYGVGASNGRAGAGGSERGGLGGIVVPARRRK